MKIILNVPYSDKEEVKEFGAKWDGNIRRWYFDQTEKNKLPQELEKWVLKIKEGAFLYVDLIPLSSWFVNIRSEVKVSEWNKIRKEIYKRDNNSCIICGGKGSKHPVEAHERWEYNKDTKIQKLIGIESLCPSCHEVTHIGLASIRGRMEIAVEHLKMVNKWSSEEANKHIEQKAEEWEKRSKIDWKVNLSYMIDNFEGFLSEETIQSLLSSEKINKKEPSSV